MTAQQIESKLSTIGLESWNRVRSANELQSLISRREIALQGIDLNEA